MSRRGPDQPNESLKKKSGPAKPDQDKQALLSVNPTTDGPRHFAPDEVPEKLTSYVPQNIWSRWSKIRRESFVQIVKNPNAFFYRNRPPGDPQKFGPFTKQEEVQFFGRLTYFREELGINCCLWGLFAVPIRGRVGYQCSNFYRSLVSEGKIKDDNYEMHPDGKLQCKYGPRTANANATQILEKEAFDFIASCLAPDCGEVPRVTGPIRVDSARPVRAKASEPSDEFTGLFGRKRKLPERHYNGFQEIDMISGGKGGPRGRGARRPRNVDDDRLRCPICGAPDPLSSEPIEKPMMDSDGFVMDLRSWRKVFRGEKEAPRRISASCEADLIELTASNFQELKLFVTNIAC
jgi:hypothetical protein